MAEPVVSVQLYSVRDHLADLDGTLARLVEAGAQAVEPFWILDESGALATALARHGLRAPTAHAPFLSDEILFQGTAIAMPPPERFFEAARALGVEVLFDPMVQRERWRSRDQVLEIAERLNRLAEVAEPMGLRLGLHNHSFEFHEVIDGAPAYEWFASQLDDRVALELDIFWAATASQDVPSLVERLGSRVRALHLKDGPVGVDPFESADDYDPTLLGQVTLGQGDLPVQEILAAATYRQFEVIEFDHVAGDVFTAIADSIMCVSGRVR